MRFSKSLILVFVLLLGYNSINAQSESDLKAKKDSLLAYKNRLKILINEIRSDLDTLTKVRDYLDEKVKKEFTELYVLKYGPQDGNSVANGRIWKGMSMDMLKDSWGKPDKINVDKYKHGNFTQLFYGDITFFFDEKNILTDWEDKGKK